MDQDQFIEQSEEKNLDDHCQYGLNCQITPKKQGSLIKLEQNDIEPTLQKKFPQGTSDQLKRTQHFRNQRRKIKKPWTHEQDELLRKLVKDQGAKEWAYISSYFPERCGKQCRQRWHNHLRNGIRKGQWSQDEEWILYLGVQAHGKKWSTISRMLEGRTQNTLKNHWNCKMKPKRDYFESKLKYTFLHFQKLISTLSITESRLLQEINSSHSNNFHKVDHLKVNRMVELIKKSLSQFYEVKRQIYEEHQMEISEEIEVKQKKCYDFQSFPSFGKNRKLEGTTCGKTTKKTKQTLRENSGISLSEEQKYLCSPFDAESTPFKCQAHDNAESHIRLAQDREAIFQEKPEIHDENSSNFHESNDQVKSEYSKYEIIDFCSPIKMNNFDKIDLGESNKKKRLFS